MEAPGADSKRQATQASSSSSPSSSATAAAAAAAATGSSSSSSSSSPAAAAAAWFSSSTSSSSADDADEGDDEDDEDDEDYEEADDDGEEEEEDSAPVGSVLPSRFLAVALRWLLQDLNPGLYSIPFMPTPLVDLIASYAAEDDLSQQALSVRIDHASVHDLTLHSTSGPDCVEEMVEDLDWRDGDREDETVTELASLYAQLDTLEAKEWKAAEGLASDVNEQNAYEEAQGWSSEQQGEAATRMARALVAASKAPPATVHPSLAAFLAHHPQVLLSIRQRTARLRSPRERACAVGEAGGETSGPHTPHLVQQHMSAHGTDQSQRANSCWRRGWRQSGTKSAS
jgi:hypothetical protein